MKKLILIIAVLLGNCVSTTQLEIPEFQNRIQAMNWVHDSVLGVYRENYWDWQTPGETLESGEGVCADMSLLLMKIFKEQFNDEPIFVSIVQPITDHGTNLHVVVYSKGEYYDPTFNQSPIEYNYDVFLTLSYDDALSVASTRYSLD